MYSSLMELSLAKYVEIEDSGRYYLLDKNYDYNSDKSSKPIPMMVLYEKWNELTMDFQNRLDSNSMKDLYLYKSKAILYKSKYDMVVLCLKILEREYDSSVIDILSELGFYLEYSEVEKVYKRNIQRLYTEAKGLLSESVASENILLELNKKAKTNGNNDDMEDKSNVWLKILVNLGIANQCHYKPSDVSCYEFLELYKIALKNNKKK